MLTNVSIEEVNTSACGPELAGVIDIIVHVLMSSRCDERWAFFKSGQRYIIVRDVLSSKKSIYCQPSLLLIENKIVQYLSKSEILVMSNNITS